MRPFLQRIFVVLWLLWALVLGIGAFQGVLMHLRATKPPPFSEFIVIGVGFGALMAAPLMLLQYLVLGFFNPLRLFASKSPPA